MLDSIRTHLNVFYSIKLWVKELLVILPQDSFVKYINKGLGLYGL